MNGYHTGDCKRLSSIAMAFTAYQGAVGIMDHHYASKAYGARGRGICGFLCFCICFSSTRWERIIAMYSPFHYMFVFSSSMTKSREMLIARID
jgi:hypothetical protein